jgi:hypothetical protein
MEQNSELVEEHDETRYARPLSESQFHRDRGVLSKELDGKAIDAKQHAAKIEEPVLRQDAPPLDR